ncbi:unnamed protein product [Caretta caretta]
MGPSDAGSSSRDVIVRHDVTFRPERVTAGPQEMMPYHATMSHFSDDLRVGSNDLSQSNIARHGDNPLWLDDVMPFCDDIKAQPDDTLSCSEDVIRVPGNITC